MPFTDNILNIYHNIAEFESHGASVVTIGTFDGVHYGHQKIIRALVERARAENIQSTILTFFPHPRMIIDPENSSLKMINTIAEKAAILQDLGVNNLIITPFTRDFSNQPPDDYIKDILVGKIKTHHLIIGYDHRFGKDRAGGLATLKRGGEAYGFTVEEIPEQDIHDVAVSSTKIRTALYEGNVALAADYLGYNFSLCGQVIKGDKIGRTIGFPTANIFIAETYKLIPGDGIYAVTVALKSGSKSEMRDTALGVITIIPERRVLTAKLASDSEMFKGMAYIGQRPTINGMTRNIEVNIFDFNEEIYGQDIRMEFHAFLRGDEKFSGLEALKEQLKKDKEDTLAYFETYSGN